MNKIADISSSISKVENRHVDGVASVANSINDVSVNMNENMAKKLIVYP